MLPKTAGSAQTHKSMSFIWIVWSTLYVYLWGQDEQGKVSWIVSREISDFWFLGIWNQFPDLKKGGLLAFAALGSNSEAFGPEGQDDQGKVSWIVISSVPNWMAEYAWKCIHRTVKSRLKGVFLRFFSEQSFETNVIHSSSWNSNRAFWDKWDMLNWNLRYLAKMKVRNLVSFKAVEGLDSWLFTKLDDFLAFVYYMVEWYLQEMPKMVLNIWSLSGVELLQFVAHNLCGFDLGLEAGSR